MKYSQSSTLILFLFLFLAPLDKSDAQQSWTIYNTSNSGLIDDRAYCLTIDSSGTTWIGTYRGASRFDGSKWDTLDQSIIARCYDMLTTRDGFVWIASRGYLYRYQGDDVTEYANAVNDDIVEDERGHIWGAGGQYAQLSRFDRYSMVSYGNANHIEDVCIDSAGNKWCCKTGVSGYCHMFDGVSWKQNFFPARAVATHPDGRVFCGDENGISIYDGTKWVRDTLQKSNSGLPTNTINLITFEPNGTMWVGTDFGIARFDGIEWQTYTTGNSYLPADYIHDIDIDRNGFAWICTNQGIAVFKPDGTTHAGSLESAPTFFHLGQNYPNPVTTSTTIPFTLSEPEYVRLSICDVLGREVAVLVNGERMAGEQSVPFDAAGLRAGIYFSVLRTGSGIETRKSLLLGSEN